MSRIPLSESSFVNGMISSLPLVDERLADSYAPGSRNQLLLGLGTARPWGGLLSKGANTGSRKMVQIGSTWGGIKDIGGLQGSGSFFEDIGRSRWMIGAGQPSVEGVDMTAITLSTILQVAIAVAGVYDAAHTFDAGLPQPSSPDVALIATPGAGYLGITNGPVSFKIARERTSTGARSIASLTSAVLVPAKQSIRITFPLASSGQKHWRVFATQEGFGGIGLHYALRYGIGTAAVLDIPESVVAAGVVDGVARSLEFDYNTGDLVPELAYIDDYPPPAGTHAVRLENVMVVLGAFVDSSSSVSSTNTGTVGACSLPNFYESYKPSHRVYFPEQIVDHRARQTDSYAYVALRNGIVAMQYVGLRDGPAIALTMILPDVGISRQSNWCQVGGLLYMRVANGGFIRMRADGSIDYAWAAPIWQTVKDWDDSTVIAWHPDTMSVVISNGGESYSYCLLNEQWSPTCYFADAGIVGNALSGVNARGEMILTVNNAGAHTAYSWDKGATEMLITSITPWTNYRPYRARSYYAAQGSRPSLSRSVRIRELEVAFETDSAAAPLIVAIFRNLRQTFVRDAVTMNASNQITSLTLRLGRSRVGDMIVVFGEDVGGAGIDYLIGRILTSTAGAPNLITIGDPTTGAPLNCQASLSGLYMNVARQIFPYAFTDIDAQHSTFLKQPYVFDAQSYAIGFTLLTNATKGQIHSLQVAGNLHGGSSANIS